MAGTPQKDWRISEQYRPRPIRFIEVLDVGGWRLKSYSIVHGGAALDRPLYDAGMQLAFAALPRPAVTDVRPGVGFIIAHHGRGMHYLVLCWWDNENECPIRVFVRRFGAGEAWRPARAGESVCVWDLQVVWFEREAYVVHVLGSDGPDLEKYLARRLETGG